MTSSFFVITVFVLILAWANGANDISKGVATLVGNGTTNAKRAVLWGTFWTVTGGLATLIWGAALLKTFSRPSAHEAVQNGKIFDRSLF